MLYVKIYKENRSYVIEFWYNTDLRTTKFYTFEQYGSFEMMQEILDWVNV